MGRRLFWFGLGAASAVAARAVWRSYSAEMARARARVRNGSAVFQCRFGAMEYATAGEGPPVIVIHGAGGGFDQGLALSSALIAAGRKVVAPSRFGYLRSALPPDPSPENQADAFADLLDELGIEQAPVLGGSAGALSALQFAIRHPDRCSAIVVVVPAAFGQSYPPPHLNAFTSTLIEYGLRSNFLFWAARMAAEDALIGSIMATDPALVINAEPGERARIRGVLRDVLPLDERAAGLKNDAVQIGTASPMPLEKIKAPALAISLEDDRFGTIVAAREIAKRIEGAKLVTFSSGGHLWAGHNEEMFKGVNTFLTEAVSSREAQTA